VRAVRRYVGIAVVLLVLAVAVSAVATTSTLYGTRFKAGETIQFKIEDSTTWWWGCCSCPETSVLGWHITNSAGQTVYNAVNDSPVPASSWVGTWAQVDANDNPVGVGQYILYVDTSVGTLSRYFTIYDPCGCNYQYWCNTCEVVELPSITNCACRTTLVFIDTCQSGCFPFFWWFGCCSSPCSSCSGSP
jgi:hypothetical protein